MKLRTDEALRLVNKQGWHKHASFGGVYLPQELWTPADANELGDLPSKYVAATIASALASIGFPQGRRTVALSPFLAELGDANATEKVFSGICRIGGVDWLLMPQDSVAVRLAPYHANLPDLRTKYGEKLQPLLKAFQAAAKDRATFGINVEAFRSSGCSAPASWARVAAQLELANDLKPQRLGTYELFADWATGELLDSYLSEHPVMRTKGVPPRPRR